MPNMLEVYKCKHCGNMVEVLVGGGAELVCCGEEMQLQTEGTVDAAKEKHVPVIEKTENGYLVKVGAVAHPMEEKHYIEWIEVMVGDTCFTKILKPGDAPEAEFCACGLEGDISVRAYCNLHGLWKA